MYSNQQYYTTYQHCGTSKEHSQSTLVNGQVRHSYRKRLDLLDSSNNTWTQVWNNSDRWLPIYLIASVTAFCLNHTVYIFEIVRQKYFATAPLIIINMVTYFPTGIAFILSGYLYDSGNSCLNKCFDQTVGYVPASYSNIIFTQEQEIEITKRRENCFPWYLDDNFSYKNPYDSESTNEDLQYGILNPLSLRRKTDRDQLEKNTRVRMQTNVYYLNQYVLAKVGRVANMGIGTVILGFSVWTFVVFMAMYKAVSGTIKQWSPWGLSESTEKLLLESLFGQNSPFSDSEKHQLEEVFMRGRIDGKPLDPEEIMETILAKEEETCSQIDEIFPGK